jgi:autotransporter-associated beta strand protein
MNPLGIIPRVVAVIVGQAACLSLAADGTWKSSASGNWSAGANWNNALVAAGTGATASFTNPPGVTVNQDLAGLTLGSLTVAGASFVYTNAALTFTNAANAAATVVVEGTNTAQFKMALNSAGELVKAGAGTLTLSANSQSVNGPLTLNGGTLFLGTGVGGDGLRVLNNSVTVNSGATLKYGGYHQIHNQARIEIKAGGVLDMNGKNDVLGGFFGAGVISNMSNYAWEYLNMEGGNRVFSGVGYGLGRIQLRGTQPFLLGTQGCLSNVIFRLDNANQLGFVPGVGSFTIGGLTGTVSSALALQATNGTPVTLTLGGRADDPGIDPFLGRLSGPGGLTKVGRSTLTLSGANTYTGATTVKSGKLVGLAGGACANSAVTLAAAPGATAVLGVCVTNTELQWACASLSVSTANTGLAFDFGSLVPGASVAPLTVLGRVTFAAVPSVTVALGGGTGTVGTRYPLLTWGSLEGVPPTAVTVNGVPGALAHLEVSANTLYLVIDLPAQAFVHVKDYGFMWWQDGIRTLAGAVLTANQMFNIKTSRYAFSFDASGMGIAALFPLTNAPSETVAFTESNAGSFPASPAVGFSCTVTTGGVAKAVTRITTDLNEVQLIEAGKFYQHRWIKVRLASGPPVDASQSGLEVCAWPDRLSLVARIRPLSILTNCALDMKVVLPARYAASLTNGDAFAVTAADGTGFVFLKSTNTIALTYNAATREVQAHTAVSSWSSNVEASVGMIIYPLTNATDAALADAVATETAPLAVTASQVAPTVVSNLASAYEADSGCTVIGLRSDGGAVDNLFERTLIIVSNPTDRERVARLNFAKNYSWPRAPGTVVFLRDVNGHPTGIPVQHSKNWHTSTTDRWKGTWFHGLTMVTVPARSTLSFEAAVVSQNFGGVPAASHAQLCLVGWYSQSQQWDEAAIGSYHEALCYEPDGNQIQCAGADSRPLLIRNTAGATKQWTVNVGGCDFVRYYDSSGARRHPGRMRTLYRRSGPCLAEAVYSGRTADNKIEFTYSAAVTRSSDITRGLHRLRLDVTQTTDFSRLVFFQMNADSYNYNVGNQLAYGSADQTNAVRQWAATFGLDRNIGTAVALTGNQPWASLHNGSSSDPTMRAANRGYIVRSWKARLNGVDQVPPYIVERSVSASTGRTAASELDLVPPPSVTRLLAGDYVEAEIERVYLPKAAGDYYGPDTHLTNAVAAYGNTYNLVLREAVGNSLSVSVQAGTLLHIYPIEIAVTNDAAQFSVTGGLGYVPVTFTGVSTYREPVVEERVGQTWVAVDPSLNGNDYWQTDYNSSTLRWEITYNLPLGSASYQTIPELLAAPVTRTFRFRSAGSSRASGFVMWVADQKRRGR